MADPPTSKCLGFTKLQLVVKSWDINNAQNTYSHMIITYFFVIVRIINKVKHYKVIHYSYYLNKEMIF